MTLHVTLAERARVAALHRPELAEHCARLTRKAGRVRTRAQARKCRELINRVSSAAAQFVPHAGHTWAAWLAEHYAAEAIVRNEVTR